MVKITVCRSCGWPADKIRREVKRLRSEHPDLVKVVQKACLDRCRKAPAVRIARKTLAPARPKKLRRAVEKALAQDA